MSSFLSAVLARAQGFLLEPAEPRLRAVDAADGGGLAADLGPDQLEIAVLGLSAGCGTSTVASALALGLGVPDARSAHVISVRAPTPTPAEARGTGSLPSRWEVPSSLSGAVQVSEYGQMVARLAGRPAALVWDIGTGQVERAARVVAASDPVLLVADDTREPSLAELVTDMLAERFGRVLLVANRVSDPERWERRAVTCLPGSRIAAALVARGRRPPGAFWTAVTELRTFVDRPA